MPEIVKKLAIVGDGTCGKTSILYQLCKSVFPDFYKPTILDHFSLTLRHGNREATLSIWDTSGTEEWTNLRKLAYADANLVLIVFDVANRTSLENALVKWAPEVQEFCSSRVPIVLVGNKIDLRDGSKITVSADRGRYAAKLLKSQHYVECSALTRHGINDLTDTLKTVLFKSKLCILF